MKFLIMNGAGNRFGVFDARNAPGFALSDAQTVEIAKPGGKVMGETGADQIVILRAPKSPDADIFMEIRNQKRPIAASSRQMMAYSIARGLGTLKLQWIWDHPNWIGHKFR